MIKRPSHTLNAFLFALMTYSTPSYGKDFDTIKPELEHLKQKALNTLYEETREKLNTPIPKHMSQECKRIDLQAYQKNHPYFKAEYEYALNNCVSQYAYTAWNYWDALENAKLQNEPIVLEQTIKFIKNKQYKQATTDSPYRLWVDSVIEHHTGGLSQEATALESYKFCSQWANKNPELVMSEYSPSDIDNTMRDVSRGSIVCVAE